MDQGNSSEQIAPRNSRSGRTIRAPVRYEPDPSTVLEDDFSDSDCSCSENIEFSGGEEDNPIQYESGSEFYSESSSSDEESCSDIDNDESDIENVNDDDESDIEHVNDDESGILDWEELTDNASDVESSDDEEF